MQPGDDLILDLPHEHFGARARLAQLPSHTLQAKREPSRVRGSRLAGSWYRARDGVVTGEITRKWLGERYAAAWGRDTVVILRRGDDVGIADETGYMAQITAMLQSEHRGRNVHYAPLSLRRTHRLPSLSSRLFRRPETGGVEETPA